MSFLAVAMRVFSLPAPATANSEGIRPARSALRLRRVRSRQIRAEARAEEPFTVKRLRGFSAEREAAEQVLARHGITLPLTQQSHFQRDNGSRDAVLLVAYDAASAPIAAIGAGIVRSRAMPGHRIYRVERLGAAHPEEQATCLAALSKLGSEDPLCLRVVVEVFERDDAARAQLRESLVNSAFVRVPTPRMYERTFALDLHGTSDELFAALKRSTRRNIRAAAKRGMEVRVVTDPSFAPRIETLIRQSFERTNAVVAARPWKRIIAMSARVPQLSRIVGLFDLGTDGLESMIAVAWGCVHGAYVTYEEGASNRRPDLGNAPLSYALLWNLIDWARTDTSVTWFDLGGAPHEPVTAAQAGIAEFKRFFSEQLVDVGEQWHFEPHPVRARIARAVHGVAQWFT